MRRPGPRLIVDRMLLRLPVVGGLLREILAARFTRVLGTLLLNGVPLIAALGVVRDALGNLAASRPSSAPAASARAAAGCRPAAGRGRRVSAAHHPPAAAGRGERAAWPDGAARRGYPRGAHAR